MPNFVWLLQCFEEKMDVSQDFTDSPRILNSFLNCKAKYGIFFYKVYFTIKNYFDYLLC